MNLAKRLGLITLGLSCASGAVISRWYGAAEVADVLGSHELKSSLEHILAGVGISLIPTALCSDLHVKDKEGALFRGWGYASFCLVWETKQVLSHGYFQWYQFAADLLGISAALTLTNKEILPDFYKRTYKKIQDLISL